MNKTNGALRVSALFLAVLMILFCFAGCGGSGSGKVSGTYKLTKAVEDGETYDAEALASLGMSDFSLTFNSDGTGVTVSEDGEKYDFTWTQNGNDLVLTAEGDPTNAKVDGNTVIMDLDGAQFYYTK